MTVTKEEFEAYLVVRDSSVTNMFDVHSVIFHAESMCDMKLTKEKCFYIMKHFDSLMVKFKSEPGSS